MVTTKTYEFRDVRGNHTISAEFTNMVSGNFVFNHATVRYKIGSGNWVTPTSGSTITNIPISSTITVEVTPSTGYSGGGWEVTNLEQMEVADSGTFSGSTPYTFTFNADYEFECEISVTVQTFTITASAGTGGTINPSGSVSVNYGGSQTFTITASTGYVISRILVDGSPIQL